MLSERQKATYDLILKNSLQGRTTTQREIFENYPISEYKDGYVWSTNPNSHDNCSQVWKDIVEINFSEEVDKIIIAKNFTYKIATNEPQATIFAERYLYSGLAKLKRYRAIRKKINANGTGRLEELEPHIRFIESYLGEGKWKNTKN